MEHSYTVNVCGGDQPGVLTSASRAVEAAGDHIKSARKAVVDGSFTMIMTVNLPDRWGPTQLAEALRREGWPDWEHAVMAQPPTTREEPASTQRTQPFVVTVWGEDRPGVAGRLDMCLAAKGIPITDLCGEWNGEEFALVAHVAVPANVALDSLQADLERQADEKEVAGGHFGLCGIEAQSHLLGGYVAVDSCPGHGTRITVGVPALRTLIEGMHA